MDFREPAAKVDTAKVLTEVATALVKLKLGSSASAALHLPKVWTAIKAQEEQSPETNAWRFVTQCVAVAVADVLGDLGGRSELNEAELAKVVVEVTERVPSVGTLRPIDITNLSLVEDLNPVISSIPEHARKVAPEHGQSDDKVLGDFRTQLALSASRVLASDPDRFGAIVAALTGPTSEAERREIGWRRHAAWVQSLFHQDPIFSPDSSEETPLAAAYIKLRCFWAEEPSVFFHEGGEERHYQYAYIADLHDTMHDWLARREKRDDVVVVAGGPGSGKSSFARAFASEVIQEDQFRVLFVRLQHVQPRGTLRDTIGTFLRGRHGWRDAMKTEGFEHNPLDWHGTDTKPLLMIFDGLDEISARDAEAKEKTRDFLRDLRLLLNDLNAAGHGASALVLGRTSAVQEVFRDAELRDESLIHVAPIHPIDGDEVRRSTSMQHRNEPHLRFALKDPQKLAERDERLVYWQRWQRTKGLGDIDVPEALTDPRMHDLNSEPLLLHLLIISDYCGSRWQQAAENRNLVYRDILQKVFRRNKDKDLEVYRGLEEEDFFDLMEAFGLSALRGNGRTGTHEEFIEIRDRYALEKVETFQKIEAAELKNVALQIHTRQDAEGAGFEFIHKSFGEYLAARALLGAGKRTCEEARSRRGKARPEDVALDWVRLIGPADLTEPVIRFLRDEARLWSAKEANEISDDLAHLFDWGLQHGWPVHKDDDLRGEGFRTIVDRGRCAEAALLAVVTTLKSVCSDSEGSDTDLRLVKFESFTSDEFDACRAIQRVVNDGPVNRPVRLVLKHLNLSRADLSRANLIGADLSGADLSRAILIGANLSRADLSEANLSEANLGGAKLSGAYLIGADLHEANLGGADLREANLSGSKLSGAYLIGADLREAKLGGADLRRADLHEANLGGADLREANLGGADLGGAKLREAYLGGADLGGADLGGADLREADLSGANFQSAALADCRFARMSARAADFSQSNQLTQEQVNVVYGVKSGIGRTIIPDHIRAPDHWHIAVEAEVDDPSHREAFQKAYMLWVNSTSEG